MKYSLTFLLILSNNLYAQTNPDLPSPSVLTENYLKEISGRKIGQTKFAYESSMFARPTMSSSRSAGARMENDTSSSERSIQEADVYKLGKNGKKELFLLNRHRGFQVVSFIDGLEKPKLVGRFPVYNNWNSEMYYLEKEEKVIVVNTEWSHSINRWQSNYNTKVYLMDVSNSEDPKLIKEISVPGYLQQSRMVGDVLYTITNNNAGHEMKAMISSVKLKDGKFINVDQEELHGENRWVTNMNVVKEADKFYVISTLSNWNGKGDAINVHDITSDQGKIEKLFTANARGRVMERSQVFLHKKHLFAVSNYRANTNERARISVEAFPLEKSATVLESKENMRVSVGDTNGLDASLQDVRISGDLLYAFWVPANNIDPFELFDISDPSKGLKHLGQLQFEGWVSKAFPIEYKNKKYVLGLGSVVPVTSERNKRFPQAKLFEIKKFNNTYKHEEVGSITLDSDDVWTSLNAEDKYFEILEEKPGVYNILFPVTFSKNWKSGAKIVTADLNSNVLTEGASVVGDQGWLNRVFVNREVQAINTFSDVALESFNLSDMASGGMAKTVSALELARNIVDFHVMDEKQGFQIINKEKSVEIRQVDLDQSDAEIKDVLGSVSVKGNYKWHKVKGSKLFVITAINKKIPATLDYPYYDQEQFDYATFNVVDLSTGKVSSEKIETKIEAADTRYFYFELSSVSSEKEDLITIGKQIFKLEGESLRELPLDQNCQYFYDQNSSQFSLHAVGADIFAFNSFTVPQTFGRTTYSMPFIKKLSLNEKSISCSASISVPGKPVAIQNSFLVTTDSVSRSYYPYRFAYSYGRHSEFPGYNRSEKTFTLKFNSESEVELKDILKKDITAGLYQEGFVTFTPAESRLDLWSINSAGEFSSRPQYLDGMKSNNSSLITVQKLNGKNLIFMKNDKKVDLYELPNNKSINQLNVTSTHDLEKEDGSAEFIFDIQAIGASKDNSKLFISQGFHGVSEIIIK